MVEKEHAGGLQKVHGKWNEKISLFGCKTFFRAGIVFHDSHILLPLQGLSLLHSYFP